MFDGDECPRSARCKVDDQHRNRALLPATDSMELVPGEAECSLKVRVGEGPAFSVPTDSGASTPQTIPFG